MSHPTSDKAQEILNSLKEGKLPSRDTLYENPIKDDTITIKVKWWEVKESVMEFIEELLEGYLWEVKFGTSFIAVHDEAREAERILHWIQSLKHREETKDRWVPNRDEEEALILVDFARLVPKMWD